MIRDWIKGIWESLNVKKMFNTLSYRYSKPFTLEERAEVIFDLELAGCIPTDIRQVSFYWNSKMGKERVCQFSIFKPNSVYVSDAYHFSASSTGFKRVIPNIGHELRHRKQYFTMSILYFLVSVPLVRDLTIEVDARNIENVIARKLGVEDFERL